MASSRVVSKSASHGAAKHPSITDVLGIPQDTSFRRLDEALMGFVVGLRVPHPI